MHNWRPKFLMGERNGRRIQHYDHGFNADPSMWVADSSTVLVVKAPTRRRWRLQLNVSALEYILSTLCGVDGINQSKT
jgi:hypothetical protein